MPGKNDFWGYISKQRWSFATSPNIIWYEADIDYEFGFRGTERILFSNDGLIFVIYDHYYTFVKIE